MLPATTPPPFYIDKRSTGISFQAASFQAFLIVGREKFVLLNKDPLFHNVENKTPSRHFVLVAKVQTKNARQKRADVTVFERAWTESVNSSTQSLKKEEKACKVVL